MSAPESKWLNDLLRSTSTKQRPTSSKETDRESFRAFLSSGGPTKDITVNHKPKVGSPLRTLPGNVSEPMITSSPKSRVVTPPGIKASRVVPGDLVADALRNAHQRYMRSSRTPLRLIHNLVLNNIFVAFFMFGFLSLTLPFYSIQGS